MKKIPPVSVATANPPSGPNAMAVIAPAKGSVGAAFRRSSTAPMAIWF
jgi:hypothetical protein